MHKFYLRAQSLASCNSEKMSMQRHFLKIIELIQITGAGGLSADLFEVFSEDIFYESALKLITSPPILQPHDIVMCALLVVVCFVALKFGACLDGSP